MFKCFLPKGILCTTLLRAPVWVCVERFSARFRPQLRTVHLMPEPHTLDQLALFLSVSNHPFAKFSLVSILKIFSFFGVFSVLPYGMTFNFNLNRDIVARI